MIEPTADETSSHDSNAGNSELHFSWLTRLTHGKTAAVCALIFVLVGVSLTGIRAYRQYATPDGTFDFSKPGLSDFHNGALLPSLAFRQGVNPYSPNVCEKYKMSRSAPPYSPVVFMFYAPLTYLSLEQADVAFFLINLILIGVIAWLGFTMSKTRCQWIPWLWVLGLLVYSRPGHITLVTGYFTAQLVIGTLVAIHFAKTRPFISGLGLLLASGKPTYILPLTILMLCRKNFKAVAIGMVFCAAGAGIGLGWLASHSSFGEVVAGVKEGQAALHADPTEDPVNTWTRLDAAGVVSKVMAWKPGNETYFVVMLLMLVIPGIAVWRNAESESNQAATGLTGMIVCVAMLISIYHHSYDALLVAVAWVGVTFYGRQVCPELRPFELGALGVLLGIPAVNYLATLMFRELIGAENQSLLWNSITLINGVCLLVALLVLLKVALFGKRPEAGEPGK